MDAVIRSREGEELCRYRRFDDGTVYLTMPSGRARPALIVSTQLPSLLSRYKRCGFVVEETRETA